jgi:hypothetical protein
MGALRPHLKFDGGPNAVHEPGLGIVLLILAVGACSSSLAANCGARLWGEPRW